ncbi:MAG: 30S ribosomal protein S3 [Planctomycetota bacterium]|nr:30S ribosomal protein S3 [Planctomycetota bacterium]
MGQKVHPYGFRVGITLPWTSRWFARKKEYGALLIEDQTIKRLVRARLRGGLSKVEIERAGSEVRVILHTSRPGVVIGRRGAEVDRLKQDIEALLGGGRQVAVNIREITKPELDAQLVAENVAEQILKRTSYRRAMKKAVETAMGAGAIGIKVICSGRLAGAEIARSEQCMEGSLPLHTLTADVDYGFAEAKTGYGVIGVKVWIYKGTIPEDRKHAVAAQES